jgi:hypothetical protein
MVCCREVWIRWHRTYRLCRSSWFWSGCIVVFQLELSWDEVKIDLQLRLAQIHQLTFYLQCLPTISITQHSLTIMCTS